MALVGGSDRFGECGYDHRGQCAFGSLPQPRIARRQFDTEPLRNATKHVPDAIGNIPLHGSTKTMSTANLQDHWQSRWLPTYAPPMPGSPRIESATEVFAGLVERVTFHNEDSGFCVLRVKARGKRDLITVVGHAAVISAGEFIQASGEWSNDRTHGVQFRARFLKAMPPTTAEGIQKYLGSGMIRGIGPVNAKKLVGAFGDKVFDVIGAAPERLREVTGIGPKRADAIVAGWAEQQIVREIMIFLHNHGVGTSRAVRIYKTYGAEAVQVISEDPYRLAREILHVHLVAGKRRTIVPNSGANVPRHVRHPHTPPCTTA